MTLKAVDLGAHNHNHQRNPGFDLDLGWMRQVRMNRSALERRASTIGTRRSVKKQWQAAWLLRAITFIDLTTLNGDDSAGRVERLCAKARQPVRPEILKALGADGLKVNPGAVCVYHNFVETAVNALQALAFRLPLFLQDFLQALPRLKRG